MASNKASDPEKTVALVQKLVVLLADEFPGTRQRAIQAALAVLGDVGLEGPSPIKQAGDEAKVEPKGDSLALFEGDEKLKPSENAYLCAAYHYSLYGNAPFSLEELRGIAREAGIVIPDRLDMTLKQAGKGGKKFFQAAGRDTYKPTTTGGLFFAERWKVKPGKKAKAHDTRGE